MATAFFLVTFGRARARNLAAQIAGLFVFVACLITLPATSALAQGVLADKPDVQAALNRLQEVRKRGGHNAGILSESDRALLFANNDAINKAGMNGEIPQDLFDAAQDDFKTLNRSFAEQAANEAGAKFTVQKSSSSGRNMPGTDSDYITEVTRKEQIPQMQEGYNKRVNDYLKQNGVTEQRNNWHNKLDTDFMADPSHITDPDEFRKIADYNNDAYKRRMAAEYERISRAGDGTRIGPEHVEGYMDEMNDFIHKKRGKIDKMLAEGPAYFSDPAKRAELFQAMAQEQKYTSRLESLDDFLRAQEGLPPRNRGVTAAKLGSNRAPGNAANIRAGHAVGEASRLTAMEDLAETMGQVARKNPGFNPNAADDIARIVEGLPPGRRAGVLARIRANGNAGLVDDILDASRSAGRLPPGSSLADDIARAGSKFDDMVDAASRLDDLADAGTGRGALGKAVGALEAIGKAADTLEGAAAAVQLADLFRQLHRASDPGLSTEERNTLLEKIRQAANDLRDSAALGAIMQRHPAIAAIYGAWTIGCMAGEFRSASTEASGGCLDRQMSAWDRATQDIQSWWTGNPTARDAHAQALCDKFTAAVREKRIKMKPGWKVVDACNWIRYGNPVSHMVEQVSVSPDEIGQKPKPPEVTLIPAACDVAQNNGTIAGLRDAASRGSEAARAHIAKLESVNGQIGSAEAAFDSARTAYEGGKFDAARASLNSARTGLDGLGGDPACDELAGKVTTGLSRIDQMEGALERARGVVEACDPRLLALVGDEYGTLTHPAMQTILRQASAGAAAHAAFERAKTSYSAGDLAAARSALREAQQRLAAVDSGACAGIRDTISDAQAKIDKLQDAIAAAEQSVASCDAAAMTNWRARLSKVINPAARAVKSQLEKGEQACEARQREERIADAGKRCKASFGTFAMADPKTAASDNPQCRCTDGYRWNDKNTACVKAPSEAELAAARNAWCKKNKGSGYYAGPPDSNGQSYCLPTRTTADALCRRSNRGRKGIYAGPIRANGTFDCKQKPQPVTVADGHRACQRANNNRRARASKYLGNGRWSCYIPGRQPSAQDIARGAAIIGGIISGMQQGGGGHRHTSPPPARITPHQRPRNNWPTARQPPPRCRDGQFINMTDRRCSKYW